MIRVLHFSDVINRYDCIDNVIRFCNPEHFDIHVCTMEPSNIMEASTNDRPISRIETPHRLYYPSTVLRLARLLRQKRIDILHTHHLDPTLIGLMAARLAGVRHVVVTRHHSNELYHIPSPIKRAFYFQLERRLYRGVDAVVAPSTMIVRMLEHERAPMTKVHMIHHGFDFSRFETPPENQILALRKELNLEGHFSICTVARLVPQKGHRYLFQAVKEVSAQHPELLCLILGDGYYRSALEELARELSILRHVRFLGFRKDVLLLIAGTDAVVLPSLQDSFCQVIVEAMAMKRPIVMTRIGAAEELIEDEVTGLLVSQGDAPAIAQAIRTLIDHPEHRCRMAEAGNRAIRQRLDIKDVVLRTEQLYTDLINKPRRFQSK